MLCIAFNTNRILELLISLSIACNIIRNHLNLKLLVKNKIRVTVWIIFSELKILEIIIIWWVNLSLQPFLGLDGAIINMSKNLIYPLVLHAILISFQLVMLQYKSSGTTMLCLRKGNSISDAYKDWFLVSF